MSGNYRTANGTPTTQEDPERLMWYSARCTYWTDDWSTLVLAIGSGIPTCPNCGSVGFQGEMGPWLESAEAYGEANPGYFQFLLGIKEVCKRENMMQAWQAEQKRLKQS